MVHKRRKKLKRLMALNSDPQQDSTSVKRRSNHVEKAIYKWL